MSETLELPPVAQRSRRDELRVQQHQLGSDQYQKPSDLMFNSTNDMLPSSGCLDFGHGLSASDWMINPNPSSSSVIYPLLPSHLYNLPAEIPAREIHYQSALQEIVTSSHGQQLNAVASETQGLSLSLSSKPLRAVGPLGPFRGYAVILKSSKFLKPAQELLGELCGTGCNGAKQFHKHDGCADERPNSASNYGGYDGSNSVRGKKSEASTSSLFYSSTEGGNRSECQAGSCPVVQGAEVQQKRVKLLYMQEVVCRRHRQYHQQMQMVVSSFESVAGLSSASPYTSMALKGISKKFRFLKHVISKQLRHLSRIVGEEFMSSSSSSSKGESMTTIGLKYVDQGLRKQKSTENMSLCFLDNNQPVWRPQRGLPERAVSVLRAWLFQHFLHPYPADTDKHMLATQTGLSRNQVSNWFINARVRLWKPMVEEMHTLESNGTGDMGLNSSSNKNEGKAIIMDDGGRQPCSDQGSEAQSMDLMVANVSSLMRVKRWHREKRSRMEELTGAGSMDAGMMSFPYHGATDIGGMGAVSLTLGLQHNEDSQQQQRQLRHLGRHMLHDFVG